MRCVNALIVNAMFGIQHNGDDHRAVKSHEDGEVISCVRKNFGAHHVRREKFRLMVVVLHQLQGLIQRRAGNKNNSHPVLNHATGADNFFAAFECGQRFNAHVTGPQLRVRGFAVIFI